MKFLELFSQLSFLEYMLEYLCHFRLAFPKFMPKIGHPWKRPQNSLKSHVFKYSKMKADIHWSRSTLYAIRLYLQMNESETA